MLFNCFFPPLPPSFSRMNGCNYRSVVVHFVNCRFPRRSCYFPTRYLLKIFFNSVRKQGNSLISRTIRPNQACIYISSDLFPAECFALTNQRLLLIANLIWPISFVYAVSLRDIVYSIYSSRIV